MTRYCLAGLPHSEIPGSKPACGSPRLIAACHVLRRLSSPRHPPCTLNSLTKLECLTNRRILSLQIYLQTYKFDSVVNEHRLQDHWDPLLRVSRSGASRHSKPAYRESCRPSNPRAVPGGADRDRTDDPLLAKQVLSQLSYSPATYLPAARSPGATATLVGLGRFELPTSRLSGVRSNQLSYRPSPGICRFPGN